MARILIFTFFISIILVACNDTEDPLAKECGEEVITLMNIYNCTDLYNSDTILEFEGNTATYTYFNVVEGVYRKIMLASSYNALCTYESPLVSAFLELHVEDPTLRDTVRILESGGNLLIYPTENLGFIHKSDEFYGWQNEGTGTSTLTYNYAVYFPTLGSWDADSAYFFSNLVQMRLSLNGNKQK